MIKQEFDLKYRGEKVAVHCDTEEKAKAYLALEDSFGTIWCTGKKLSETKWDCYKKKTCYSLFKDGTIVFGDLKWYRTEGYKIVEFELEETFNVGDVVYISSYGQDSQTYTIVGFENMAIIKNNRGGQKLEALSNLTHIKPLKEITEKELAHMGYVLVK